MSTLGGLRSDPALAPPAPVAPDAGGRPGVGISEVSALTGLTKDTLRWYEKEGLLPQVRRTSSGQRRYPRSSVRFVRLVQALRRTGMPVAGVRAFVQAGPAAGPGSAHSHRVRMGLLLEQREAIRAHLAQLQEDLGLIDDKIGDYADLIARGADCEDETFD